jgi:hypothetical protein
MATYCVEYRYDPGRKVRSLYVEAYDKSGALHAAAMRINRCYAVLSVMAREDTRSAWWRAL